MSRFVPQIGAWYQDLNAQLLFEIVALGPDDGTVQIQYLDGEIADLDLESWGDLLLLPAAAPEDWRSAFEIDDHLEPDAMHPIEWGNPVSGIEPEAMVGVEELI